MEVPGEHKTIDYVFKRSKRSALSGVMGKAILQLGPSVAETASFKEFISTGLRERQLIGHVSEIVFRGERSE